jgi:hypothetical protein
MTATAAIASTNGNSSSNSRRTSPALSPPPSSSSSSRNGDISSVTTATQAAARGDRSRLDSNQTNMPPETTTTSDSEDVGKVVVKEQIYFDDDDDDMNGRMTDTVTLPSTTRMERGESSSSYSLLMSSADDPNTTPLLLLATSDDHDDPHHLLHTTSAISSSSRHKNNRHRLYSGSSSSRSNRRRSSSNQEYYYYNSSSGGGVGGGNSSHHGRRHYIETPELSGLNILNALTYTVHILIWWICGVWGVDHTMYTHWEQTQYHETLLTPSTWAAHYLWVPIMIFEAVFTISQLLPHYRARPIITSGTSYFFFYTVLLQITYTLLYGFGLFVFSFISIVLALFALLSLLASQQFHSSADMTTTTIAATSSAVSVSSSSNRGFIHYWSGGYIGNGRWWSSHRMVEYVLFSFPFYLHTGWLILMAVDHFSLLFRRYNSAIDAQLASDIVGLGVLLVAAIYALNPPTAMGPDFVIPTVILWSYVRIYKSPF